MGKEKKGTNATWPDVFMKLLDMISKAINNGQALILLLFTPIIFVLISSLRMSPAGLDQFSLKILNSATQPLGTVFLVFTSNLLWFVLYRNRVKVMQSEIDRLCDERKGIIHNKNIVTTIEKHTNSNDPDLEETILFPDLETETRKNNEPH